MGHWRLDETSGILAADSSGLGRYGTVVGTATWTGGPRSIMRFELNGLTRVEVNSLMGDAAQRHACRVGLCNDR